LLFVFFLPACAQKSGAPRGDESRPVPVTVAEAKPVALRRTVPVVGTLNPYEEVVLAPKVGGKVLHVFRDVGDRVGPGEPLLELDDTEYRLAVEQAQPAFDAELRKLKLAALPASEGDFEKHLPSVDAVNEARANLRLAEAELDRCQKEINGGVGSKQALDACTNRLAVSTVRIQLAETDARVTLANARRLKAALDDARRKLADTRLNAPSPDEWGELLKTLGPTATPLKYAVAQKLVSTGEMVQSTPVTNCYRLVIDHLLKLGAAIPEKHAPDVAIGQTVEIRVEAYPNQVFTGTLTRISPTTDVGNRTFGVVITVRNGDSKLKAGGFATADVIIRAETVVTIPPEALVQFAGVNKVFVADGDRARVVEVTVGTRDKEWIEVGGLPAGAKVITSGQAQLIDGSAIRIR
jgi:multidrug efflux pump subunit AcrA (membrane-fusion protein)